MKRDQRAAAATSPKRFPHFNGIYVSQNVRFHKVALSASTSQVFLLSTVNASEMYTDWVNFIHGLD